MSVPPEVYKKAKLLSLFAQKQVNKLFFGSYRSSLKAEGMIFADFREYVPGDDVRSISWPLMARTGKPFIKRFEPEKEQVIMLAVDVSGSTEFGTKTQMKSEAISFLTALVAFAAYKEKNPVGLVLFSDEVEFYLPPTKSHSQPYQIVNHIHSFKPRSKKTSFTELSSFLTSVLKKKAMVFVISDFLSEVKKLQILSNKHEVISLFVEDPQEWSLPNWGMLDLKDPETGEMITVDSSSVPFRRDFEREMKKRRKDTLQNLRKTGSSVIEIDTSKDILLPLIQFFKKGH